MRKIKERSNIYIDAIEKAIITAYENMTAPTWASDFGGTLGVAIGDAMQELTNSKKLSAEDFFLIKDQLMMALKR